MSTMDKRSIYQEMLNMTDQEGISMNPMNEIKIDKGYYTVYELKRRYEAKEQRIIIDSEFQREDVWKRNRKIELIESVLMGLPLPIFYFTQDKYGRLIVVDGRQRLTALFEYMTDRFQLNKMKILPELNGKKFSDLLPVLQGRIEDFQIQAHVIMPPTPDRIKFDIFERVNRGGVQLNQQEIRNALYQGNATRLLGKVAASDAFARATGNAFIKEKRMKDRYLLTRLITFYLQSQGRIKDNFGQPYQYRDDIDDFLGRGLEELNQMSDQEIKYVQEFLIETLEKSFYYLGSDAFRMNQADRKSPVNMNVFETVMWIMQYVPMNDPAIRSHVKETVESFINSDSFKNNIGNHRDHSMKLQWRLEQAENMGREFRGDAK